MIIRNSYLKKIEPFIDKPLTKVITGMRRTGKSTFLQMLIQQIREKGAVDSQILWINKELVEFDSIRNYLDLYQYVRDYFKTKSKNNYLFIDEVQDIEDWEKAVASFLANQMADIYITGSNARIYSSELSTLLAARELSRILYAARRERISLRCEYRT